MASLHDFSLCAPESSQNSQMKSLILAPIPLRSLSSQQAAYHCDEIVQEA